MSLTVIVATTGRTTLADAVRTTAGRLPVERFLIVPAERPIDPEVAARADVQVLAPVAGLFAAWNAAVAEVTTSHAMFVNDDDRLDGPPLASDVLDADRPVNLPFRRAGGPVRRSVSVSIGSAIVRPVDLLHANRAGNINSFLWPTVGPRPGRPVRHDVPQLWGHRMVAAFRRTRGPGALAGHADLRAGARAGAPVRLGRERPHHR